MFAAIAEMFLGTTLMSGVTTVMFLGATVMFTGGAVRVCEGGAFCFRHAPWCLWQPP